jgi:hypothetical protein
MFIAQIEVAAFIVSRIRFALMALQVNESVDSKDVSEYFRRRLDG